MSGLTQTLVTALTNTPDVTLGYQLLHGQERYLFGDGGYWGVGKQHGTIQKWPHKYVAIQLGKSRTLPVGPLGRILEGIECLKACLRPKVEHHFYFIKSLLGLKKDRKRRL